MPVSTDTGTTEDLDSRRRVQRDSSAANAGRAPNVASVFREEWGRAVSILISVLGDFDLAEDAVQDAFTTALERWPVDGMPRNPGAWIVTTARNKAIDRIRRERTLERKTELLRTYWDIPERQIETSVVLAYPPM